MPTFIKAGYWEKMQKGLKGWLNLDDFARKYFSEAGAVTSTDISTIVTLTQEQYDALAVKSTTTMYVILES